MCRCSLLAGLLLSPINTGAAHALGYGIEKVSHAMGKAVPHGTAVALVLPGVMRHNAPAVADKYYFAAGVAGLQVFSLAQPAHPEKTASITTRAAAERVVVDNRRACVASGCVTLYQLQNTGRRRGVLSLRPGS